MSTQTLPPADAQDLAQQFHDLAIAFGNYQIANFGVLSPVQRNQLQNQVLLCIQYSNTFITQTLALEQANLAQTLQSIKQATKEAQQAVKNIAVLDKVLQVITAATVLGASIVSMNPSAIASGLQGVFTAVAGPAASGAKGAAAGAS